MNMHFSLDKSRGLTKGRPVLADKVEMVGEQGDERDAKHDRHKEQEQHMEAFHPMTPCTLQSQAQAVI